MKLILDKDKDLTYKEFADLLQEFLSKAKKATTDEEFVDKIFELLIDFDVCSDYLKKAEEKIFTSDYDRTVKSGMEKFKQPFLHVREIVRLLRWTKTTKKTLENRLSSLRNELLRVDEAQIKEILELNLHRGE